MIARPRPSRRTLWQAAIAASVALAPSAASSESADLPGSALPTESAGAAAQPRPPMIVIGRAMDLAGVPVSMVPKGRPAALAGSARFLTGPGSMPSGAPLGANRITSGFGYRSHPILGGFRLHSGIDMAAPTGARVYATMDGYVSHADWAGGYGLSVRLTGNNAVETRYSHLAGIAVGAGSYVRKGDLLGYVGSTGLSTGPHLHYEVRVNGQAVDPRGTGRR